MVTRFYRYPIERAASILAHYAISDADWEELRPLILSGRAERALEHLEEHGCNVYHWDEGETCEWQARCDEPGCKRQVTSGTPTPDGYRSTCSEHRPR